MKMLPFRVFRRREKKIVTFLSSAAAELRVLKFAAELHDFIEEDVKKKYKYIENMLKLF